jgi:poly-beta-1,6 N-acetyl-D-glucosamine synthase
MVKRVTPIVVLAAVIMVAAIGAHHFAVIGVHGDSPIDSALPGVVAVLMFAFLVLLGARYLLHLGLAAYAQSQPAPRPWSSADRHGEPPCISIIVPAFNEAPMIRNVLESLLAIDYPNCEVIVVDDGSSDQTFLRALPYQRRREDIQIRVLAKANGGKFDALNHGIAQARGEIVVCIDGDSILQRDALKYLAVHFEDPNVGAVAGNVRVVNRGTVWSGLQALEYVVGLGLIKRAQSATGTVTIVPGPIGAFRKLALAEVNGYDGDTFAEDFDLTIKLLGAGWHVVYEPRAVVLTEAPERTLDLLRQRYRWTRGSLQVLAKRKKGFFAPTASPLRFIALWYLAFESLGLPALHVGAQLLFVLGGFFLGMHELVLYWWLQLLLLDCAASLYCICVEEESVGLALLAPLFRIFYLIVLDVARLFAAWDEFARVGMNWDKLARLGRLAGAR